MLRWKIKDVEIFFHKTYEIAKIVKNAQVVVAMNVHKSTLRKIARNNPLVITSSLDVGYNNVIFNPSVHVKLYITDDAVYFSSANCSPSSLYEFTIKFPKDSEILECVDEILEILQSKHKKNATLSVQSSNSSCP